MSSVFLFQFIIKLKHHYCFKLQKLHAKLSFSHSHSFTFIFSPSPSSSLSLSLSLTLSLLASRTHKLAFKQKSKYSILFNSINPTFSSSLKFYSSDFKSFKSVTIKTINLWKNIVNTNEKCVKSAI